MQLEVLNPSQYQAATHTTGPCLCLAGPGSGKTHTLIQRIAYLIYEAGVDPTKILAMTFTRKAAAEMQNRLLDQVDDGYAVSVSTIHSVGYRILREAWIQLGQDPWTVMGNAQQKRMVRDLLEPPSRQHPHGLNWAIDLRIALSRISFWKNALIPPQDIDIRQPDGARWQALYTQYEALKERDRLIDLDDMLSVTYALLRESPDLLHQYQQQWQWILTDECQDDNLAQWEITKMLAAPRNNLFVVGDVNQSIYSFRGARPDLLMAFTKTYPDATLINLDTNYRSRPYIVTTSNALITNNPQIVPISLQPHRVAAQSDGITLWQPITAGEEAALVVRELQHLHTESMPWADAACIYRTNAQSRPLEDALVRARIPYRIIGSQGFWSRREVKDILAYLRVLHDPNDAESFKRALMTPSRYLGHAYYAALADWTARTGDDWIDALVNMPAKPYQERNARALYHIYQGIRHCTRPVDMIAAVRDLTDYDQWFLKEDVGDEDDEDRLGNLAALSETASAFSSVADLLAHADRMLAQSTSEADDADRVSLMSIHRSKGLEFPVVFTVGWTEGLLPHRAALQEEDEDGNSIGVEEERRLAYVAITRAKDRLYCSAPLTSRGKEIDPSRFLTEMGVLTEPQCSVLP